MIVKKQKKIEFNTFGDIVYSREDLAKAIIWYSSKPVTRVKGVYLHGQYPAVSIYDQKIHIHRLLMMYWLKRDLEKWEYVHHIDGNKLNALKENLEIIMASAHQSQHNKGRKFSEEHCHKLSEANRKRTGLKYKK